MAPLFFISEPPPSMKFLHAGDIHLDSALSGLSAHDEAPLELLRGATRRAFIKLIDLALAERVAFLVIPGDLFDTGWKHFQTGIFFMRQIARLHEANIPVYLLRGNHDSSEDMVRSLTPPPNLHTFGSDAPQTFELEVDGLKIALTGQSFQKAATFDNLAANYRFQPGALNIALLHTGLGGYANHQPYAPCSLDELKNAGAAYWALGHVHEQKLLHETAPTIAFSGNLQGRHVGEPGARGALMVTIAHGVIRPPRQVFLDVLRWQTATVDVGGTLTMDEAMGRVQTAFKALLDHAEERPVACRLVLTGKTAVHRELTTASRALRNNVLTQAMYVDPSRLWIEKIDVRTASPRDPAEIEARADGLAELQKLLAEARGDADFIAMLKKDFAPLLAKAPKDVFEDAGATVLHHAAKGDFAALLSQIEPDVIDRLAQED